MNRGRMMRLAALALTGGMMLQAAGCTVLDWLQTIFLGISAAGALAVLNNI